MSYTRDEIDANLCLAYACTVHKAQGSEYDAVVIVLDSDQNHMLRRSLLYTALTRARKRVYLVGSEVALKFAVTNNDMPDVSDAARDGSAVHGDPELMIHDEATSGGQCAASANTPRRWTALEGNLKALLSTPLAT